jgi:hypothetical protein
VIHSPQASAYRARVHERPAVFLHIGAPKSGTTYLQNILFANRRELRRNGLAYPGNNVRSHFWASQDLREMAFHGHVEAQVNGAWTRMVNDIRGSGCNGVIDHEILGAASEAQIDRALADLDFAEVHVIFTARDIARQLPAAWQERVKNKDTLTYRAFLDGVHGGLLGTGPRKFFWPLHDVPGILARWSRSLPPEQVHLVTLPRTGADPTLLWQRFASVLGVDPAAYNTDLARENTSLTAAEAAVLREFNARLDGVDIPWAEYRAIVKHGLSGMLGAEQRSTARIELPEDTYEWVVSWTNDAVAQLRDAGYSIVGDLDEFIPASRPTGADPDAVPADDRAAAAAEMLAAMLKVEMAEHETPRPPTPKKPRVTSREVAHRMVERARTSERLAPVRRRLRPVRDALQRRRG